MGLGFCLEEADRVEGPISIGKHHASGSKAHEAWCEAESDKVRRRRTTTACKVLTIKKFLYEAHTLTLFWTKLRPSPTLLHGLSR